MHLLLLVLVVTVYSLKRMASFLLVLPAGLSQGDMENLASDELTRLGGELCEASYFNDVATVEKILKHQEKNNLVQFKDLVTKSLYESSLMQC
jgi:hypothetical protein